MPYIFCIQCIDGSWVWVPHAVFKFFDAACAHAATNHRGYERLILHWDTQTILWRQGATR